LPPVVEFPKGRNWAGFPFARFIAPRASLRPCSHDTICQNAFAVGDPAVPWLNRGMELIGLKSNLKSFSKSECSPLKTMGGCPS
jgi:hypothetical protein